MNLSKREQWQTNSTEGIDNAMKCEQNDRHIAGKAFEIFDQSQFETIRWKFVYSFSIRRSYSLCTKKYETKKKLLLKILNPVHPSIFHSASAMNHLYKVLFFFLTLLANKLSALFLTMVPLRCGMNIERKKETFFHSFKIMCVTIWLNVLNGRKWTAARLKAIGEHEHWTWTNFYSSSSAASLGVCFFFSSFSSFICGFFCCCCCSPFHSLHWQTQCMWMWIVNEDAKSTWMNPI